MTRAGGEGGSKSKKTAWRHLLAPPNCSFLKNSISCALIWRFLDTNFRNVIFKNYELYIERCCTSKTPYKTDISAISFGYPLSDIWLHFQMSKSQLRLKIRQKWLEHFRLRNLSTLQAAFFSSIWWHLKSKGFIMLNATKKGCSVRYVSIFF